MSTKNLTLSLKKPSDIFMSEQMAYLDHAKKEFVWINEFGVRKSGVSIGPKEKVKLLEITGNKPFYKISIDENDPSGIASSKQAEIDFIKSWPLVAKKDHNGTIDSFPSKNHILEFSEIHKRDKKALISTDQQMFIYQDEEELKKGKSEDLRKLRKTNLLLGSILPKDGEDETTINNVMYMLGMNPIGRDIFTKEQDLYEYIVNADKHEEFEKIVERKIYDDPSLLAVHASISLNIINKNDSGYYQFEGSSISKEIQDVALHFRSNKVDWVNLTSELKSRGVEFPELKEIKPAKVSSFGAKDASKITDKGSSDAGGSKADFTV